MYILFIQYRPKIYYLEYNLAPGKKFKLILNNYILKTTFLKMGLWVTRLECPPSGGKMQISGDMLTFAFT